MHMQATIQIYAKLTKINWSQQFHKNFNAEIADARDRDFSIAEKWSDEKVFSNRAYFLDDRQPAELGIDHIRESDQAVYRCRVDFKMGQTRNSKVNLTVIVVIKKCSALPENPKTTSWRYEYEEEIKTLWRSE
ncbi:hypothetical protein HUJ04_005005, partial [Dendroctonus ponderosae]